MLGLELVIGSFSWMVRIPFNDKLGYFEGLFLGICNFIMAVYLHIEVKKERKESNFKDMDITNGFEEIEMET